LNFQISVAPLSSQQLSALSLVGCDLSEKIVFLNIYFSAKNKIITMFHNNSFIQYKVESDDATSSDDDVRNRPRRRPAIDDNNDYLKWLDAGSK
jgi:hypothetical protein